MGAKHQNNFIPTCFKRIQSNRDLTLSDSFKRITTELLDLKELPHMRSRTTAKEMVKGIIKKLSEIPTPSFSEALLTAIGFRNNDKKESQWRYYQKKTLKVSYWIYLKNS